MGLAVKLALLSLSSVCAVWAQSSSASSAKGCRGGPGVCPSGGADDTDDDSWLQVQTREVPVQNSRVKDEFDGKTKEDEDEKRDDKMDSGRGKDKREEIADLVKRLVDILGEVKQIFSGFMEADDGKPDREPGDPTPPGQKPVGPEDGEQSGDKKPDGGEERESMDVAISGFYCENGYGNDLNGVYEYQGQTKDGRPYYRGKARYFYFDKRCSDDTTTPRWLLGGMPDPDKEEDLNDKDGKGCHNDFSIRSDSMLPPEGPQQLTWQWCRDHGYSNDPAKSVTISFQPRD